MKKYLLILALVLILIACKPIKNTNNLVYAVTSPQTAEIICELGKQKQIVAVSNDCNYPPNLKNLPQVGMFANISIEKILNQNPSIVFTAKAVQSKLTTDLKKLGIKVIETDPLNINQYYSTIKQIGNAINAKENADSLVKYTQIQLKSLQAKFTKTPKVYIEISSNQLWSCSNNSFTGTLVNLAGGKNIFANLKAPYALVSNEDIILKNPDVIIAFTGISKQDILSRKGWQNINAIKNKRVYTSINPDIITRAGSRVVNAIKLLQKAIHNE